MGIAMVKKTKAKETAEKIAKKAERKAEKDALFVRQVVRFLAPR